VLEFSHGEVAEWFKAAVLKTAVLKGTVSSNLTLSAKKGRTSRKSAFFHHLPEAIGAFVWGCLWQICFVLATVIECGINTGEMSTLISLIYG
jgi:hypothetical protein